MCLTNPARNDGTEIPKGGMRQSSAKKPGDVEDPPTEEATKTGRCRGHRVIGGGREAEEKPAQGDGLP